MVWEIHTVMMSGILSKGVLCFLIRTVWDKTDVFLYADICCEGPSCADRYFRAGWDIWKLELEIGIGNWNGKLELEIGIGNWNWKLELEIENWN